MDEEMNSPSGTGLSGVMVMAVRASVREALPSSTLTLTVPALAWGIENYNKETGSFMAFSPAGIQNLR